MIRGQDNGLALLMGMAAGFALALAEAPGEGIPPNSGTVLLVMGIFTGMECAAILLAYALFTGYLGIFRKGV